MIGDSSDVRQARVITALHVLVGTMGTRVVNPPQRLDDDELAILNVFRDVRRSGFGKVEISVINHQMDTVHKGFTLKRKDLIPGAKSS